MKIGTEEEQNYFEYVEMTLIIELLKMEARKIKARHYIEDYYINNSIYVLWLVKKHQ